MLLTLFMLRLWEFRPITFDSITAGYRRTGSRNNCEQLVRSGAVDVIVIDSVAALVPKAEIQGRWVIPMWDSRQD